MPVAPLVTLTQCKDWLGITDTRFDAKLTTILNGVSKKIGEYCGTDFQLHVIPENDMEIKDGVRGDTIIPEWLPVLSVEKLFIHVDVTGLGGLDLDTDDYQINQWGITLKRLNTPQGRANVSLAYHGGYTEVPEDVQTAALISVEAFYNRNTRKSIGVNSRSKSVGAGTSETESYTNAWDPDSGLPKEAVGLLQTYKFFEWPGNQEMATRNY